MINKRFTYVIDNGKNTIYDLSTNGVILENFMDIEETMNNLYDENQRLTKELAEIQYIDDDEFNETKHINIIYKEQGFQGVIEYAKDQLQEYGMVKEVEEGLWVLVTGGWSDNEQWIHSLNNPISIFKRKHYKAYETGGAFYYTEKPYNDIIIRLKE